MPWFASIYLPPILTRTHLSSGPSDPLHDYRSFFPSASVLAMPSLKAARTSLQATHKHHPGMTIQIPLKKARYSHRYIRFPVLRLVFPLSHSGANVMNPP